MSLNLKDALSIPCVADTSFLSYLIFSGHAFLLPVLLKHPIFVTPTILDPDEPSGSGFLKSPPLSELLRPLFYGRDRFLGAEVHIRSFIQAHGTLWQQAQLSEAELSLAIELTKKETWPAFGQTRRNRRGLDAGEAEGAAVAISRNWTFLTEDQAAIDLLGAKYQTRAVVRTCAFLVHAVDSQALSCDDAAHLFNNVICEEYGFYAKRGPSKLTLKCSPARCEWA